MQLKYIFFVNWIKILSVRVGLSFPIINRHTLPIGKGNRKKSSSLNGRAIKRTFFAASLILDIKLYTTPIDKYIFTGNHTLERFISSFKMLSPF